MLVFQELLLSDWKIGKARPLSQDNYAARDWPEPTRSGYWGFIDRGGHFQLLHGFDLMQTWEHF